MAIEIKRFSQYVNESYREQRTSGWKIDDYEKNVYDNLLQVYCYNPADPSEEEYKVVDLNLSDFEEWLVDNVNLEWSNDYYDPSQYDGHGQDSGTLTVDEWWDSADITEIYSTIKDYMASIGISPY